MYSLKAESECDVVASIHSCSQIIGLTSFSIKEDNHRIYAGFVSFYNVLCIIISTTWSFYVSFKYLIAMEVWEFNCEYMSECLNIITLITLSSAIAVVIFVTCSCAEESLLLSLMSSLCYLDSKQFGPAFVEI